MKHVSRPVVGLVTIGQGFGHDRGDRSRRPGARGRRARRSQVGRSSRRSPPIGDDEILITRLGDGSPVFVGKQKIVGLVERRIAALEAEGATLTALLCTGVFPRLRSTRPLIQPHSVLLGTLRGLSGPGRLGVLTPSIPHVPQTEARWRRDGFDPVVAPLLPYEEEDPAAVRRAAEAMRAGGLSVIVLDCIGFRRKTRDELRELTGVPVLIANLLIARLIAEVCG